MLTTLRARWLHLTARERSGGGGRHDTGACVARAPLIVSVVLGVAVAAQAAEIAVCLLGDFTAASTAGPHDVRGAHPSGRRTSALAALDRLTSAHLFGVTAIQSAAASVRASRAPLVLTGIIATGDPTDGFAILGGSTEATHVFHAGSQTAPGTTLAEVYPQRVVLLRGGERLILTLPKASAGAQFGGQSAGIRTAPSEPEPEVASAGADGVAQEPSPGSFRPPPMSDAGALMRAFSMRPVSIGGQRGVRIMGTGMNSKTLAALGLAPGDVILQINGVPVGSNHTPDLAEALKAGSATLVVDRDGDATSVTIDPSTAASAAQDYRQAAPDL